MAEVKLGNIKGPKGDIGPRGPQGPKGDSVADSVEWDNVLSKPDVATKQDVDDIEIGGRNLIIDSKLISGWANSSGGISGTNPYKTTEYIELEKGVDYTYQFWNPNRVNTWWTAVYYDKNNNYVGGYISRYISDIYTLEIINTNKYDNAEKIRITYTEHEGKKQKLERATKATDWTPAPEDIEERLLLSGTSLPTPNSNYRGRVFTLFDNTNGDRPYICIRNKNGSYSWEDMLGVFT